MIERIGKYRVLERIGRGGMGIVLKAHDPVLDRTVALKVIAPDVEVTEELRTRFFREAQACARLSHPNIVTVFDLGDVDGRLFIVMQFLEGEELRQVIAQRRAMPLEEKIVVMMQVCDGVAYAHQHGVVHRDIKPGNIFLLRDGGVKILDFGVARIVTADPGLTRTGLIMGTLRYMAPEQARGRADHRADIFSVGSVFYEWLAHRPAFPGDDPMEILEALRTHDPPPLSDIDPAIPGDLAAIVARALRKDPAERVQDLQEMRRDLDAVRRRLLQAAEVVKARLDGALRELRQLQATAVEVLGGELADDETLPIVEEVSGLAGLEAMETHVARRTERVRALLARASELRTSVDRGLERLAAGDLEAAAGILDAVVREVPEHVRARTALAQVRTALQERRREALRRAREEAAGRQEAMLQARAEAREAGALEDAHETWRAADLRAADGEQALAREDLDAAGEHLDAAAALYRRARTEALEIQRERARAAAEAALREQERERAERSHGHVERLRAAAHAAGAVTHADRVWAAAENARAEAETALAQQAFARARERLEHAEELYRRAAEEATAAARRRAREHAVRRRDAMLQARAEGQDAGAIDDARETWRAADLRAADGEQALARDDLDAAGEHLDAAAALYRRARTEALEIQRERARAAAEASAQAALREQERERVERSRGHVERLRADAQAAGAPRDADRVWAAAENARAEAETALAQQAFARARERLEHAAELYRRASEEAGAVRRRAREHVLRRRDAMLQARADGEEAGAPHDAPDSWRAAHVRAAEGEQALARDDLDVAAEHLDAASGLYRRAGGEALEAQRERAQAAARAALREQERERAERARAHVGPLRAMARDGGAPTEAARIWTVAEQAHADGEAALEQHIFTRARERFEDAADLYRRAAEEAAATEQRRAGAADETTIRPLDATSPAVPRLPAARAPEIDEDQSDHRPGERSLPIGRRGLVPVAAATALVVGGVLLLLILPRSRDVADRPADVETTGDRAGIRGDRAGTDGISAPREDPAAVETRRRAEAQRAVEARKRAEAEQAAVEARKRAEAEHAAAEARKRAEAEQAAEARKRAEAEHAAAEARKRAEAEQAAAEARKRAEAEHAAAEARKRAEAEQAAAEARKRAEAEHAVAEARKRAEAEKAAEARKRAETEQVAAEARRRAESERAEAERRGAIGRQGQQSAAEKLRDRATAARLEAVRGPAPRAAAGLIASAQGKEAEGRAALDRRDFEVAAEAFRAAEADYLGAVRHMAKLRETTDRELGEARAAAAQSRSRAAQADAGSLAKEQFDMASTQWARAEAQAAGGDTAQAVNAFRAAAQLWAEAAQRADDARQARTLVATARSRRELAAQAGADMLAKDIFDAASARLSEGDKLAQAQDWTAALRAYQEAADRYGAAERRVRDISRLRVEAGAAKERREQAMRVGAERLVPELFSAAAARHVEADRLARGADVVSAISVYRDAAERYGRAEQRARQAERPTTPPRPEARDEIQRVLTDYARALEAKDAGRLQQLRPGLRADELQRYRQLWDAGVTTAVVLKVERIDVRGDDAEATGRREDIVVRPDGGRERTGAERAFRFKLKRGRDGWLIDTIQ
jgi:hypothetical protein